MKKMKIDKNDIIKILSKFGRINNKVTNNYNFIESGFIDSLNLLRFITNIEKKYKVTLDSEFTNSNKFGQIGHLVNKINQLKK